MTALNTLTNESGIEQIKVAISEVAKRYLIDGSGLARLINCESSFNQKAKGDNGKAVNLLQYHFTTFEENCDGEYDDAKSQLECASKMIKKGMGNRWTCFWTYIKS